MFLLCTISFLTRGRSHGRVKTCLWAFCFCQLLDIKSMDFRIVCYCILSLRGAYNCCISWSLSFCRCSVDRIYITCVRHVVPGQRSTGERKAGTRGLRRTQCPKMSTNTSHCWWSIGPRVSVVRWERERRRRGVRPTGLFSNKVWVGAGPIVTKLSTFSLAASPVRSL